MTADIIEPTTRYRAIVALFTLAYVAWTLVLLSRAHELVVDPPSLAGMSVEEARRAVNEYTLQADRRVFFATLPALLASVTCAALSARSGLRSLRSGQFPPPGAHVLWRQRIVHGSPARRQAVSRLLLAGFFGFLAERAASQLWSLLPSLMGAA